MSFLCLPREIRDQIYFFVIYLERDPPSPHDENFSTKYQAKEIQFEYITSNARYEVEPFPMSYISLSRTNRQIRAEVREAVTAVRNTGNLTYVLDLMVYGTKFYPTWLSVPVPTKHLAELKVDFRRVNNDEDRWIGKGGVGMTIRQLGRLLSRFVAHGPSFFQAAGSQSECRFEVLTVRVVDDEIREHPRGRQICEEDLNSLKTCAVLLWHYDILGAQAELVKLQYGETVAEYPLHRKAARDTDLALWSQYGWYRPTSYSWAYGDFHMSAGEGRCGWVDV